MTEKKWACLSIQGSAGSDHHLRCRRGSRPQRSHSAQEPARSLTGLEMDLFAVRRRGFQATVMRREREPGLVAARAAARGSEPRLLPRERRGQKRRPESGAAAPLSGFDCALSESRLFAIRLVLMDDAARRSLIKGRRCRFLGLKRCAAGDRALIQALELALDVLVALTPLF